MNNSAFLERSRYYLAYEYPTKIRLALDVAGEETIWRRPNEDSNSIANLMLHLAGNVTQWIVSGIGGKDCNRDRAAEFAAQGGVLKSDLMKTLQSAVRDADAVLAGLTEEDLGRSVEIQGRETTILAAIYHVVEHFSMHTGQIVMLTKIHAPGRIRFYEDAGGLAVPVWGGGERMAESRTGD